jgi:hypothetical protein
MNKVHRPSVSGDGECDSEFYEPSSDLFRFNNQNCLPSNSASNLISPKELTVAAFGSGTLRERRTFLLTVGADRNCINERY